MNQDDWQELQEFLDLTADPLSDLNVRKSDLHSLLLRFVEHTESNRVLIARILARKQVSHLIIATRLHNGPLQELSVATRDFQHEIQSNPSIDILTDCSLRYYASVRSSLGDIRDILLASSSMLPQEETDLFSQLREAIRARQKDGTSINLDISDLELLEQIPSEMSNLILQFVEETIRNAERHGGADQLKVSLYSQGDLVILRTSDNGCGFTGTLPVDRDGLRAFADRGQLGLRLIKELANPYAGHLDILPRGSELGGAMVQLTLKLE